MGGICRRHRSSVRWVGWFEVRTIEGDAPTNRFWYHALVFRMVSQFWRKIISLCHKAHVLHTDEWTVGISTQRPHREMSECKFAKTAGMASRQNVLVKTGVEKHNWSVVLLQIDADPSRPSTIVSLTVYSQSSRLRDVRSSDTTDYFKRTTSTKFGERGFSYCGSAAWNSLPPHLRTITDTNAFKWHLKSFLFSETFHSFVSAPGQVVYSGAIQITDCIVLYCIV